MQALLAVPNSGLTTFYIVAEVVDTLDLAEGGTREQPIDKMQKRIY